jgi:hypothetical protein
MQFLCTYINAIREMAGTIICITVSLHKHITTVTNCVHRYVMKILNHFPFLCKDNRQKRVVISCGKPTTVAIVTNNQERKQTLRIQCYKDGISLCVVVFSQNCLTLSVFVRP